MHTHKQTNNKQEKIHTKMHALQLTFLEDRQITQTCRLASEEASKQTCKQQLARHRANGQTGTQADKHTDSRQTDRQADKQTNRQIGWQRRGQIDKCM